MSAGFRRGFIAGWWAGIILSILVFTLADHL